MAYYVNNNVLKACIEKYNMHNLADTLDWVPRFLEKKNRDFTKGEIDKETLQSFVDFVARRQQEQAQIIQAYDAMTPEQKICFNDDFDNTKAELSVYFNKIVVGIANTMHLYKDFGLSKDECDDIVLDALLDMFKYCSRFDTKRGTSAFCYMTQMAKNSIKGFKNAVLEEKNIIVTGIDFIDNMEAGSNTQDDYED